MRSPISQLQTYPSPHAVQINHLPGLNPGRCQEFITPYLMAPTRDIYDSHEMTTMSCRELGSRMSALPEIIPSCDGEGFESNNGDVEMNEKVTKDYLLLTGLHTPYLPCNHTSDTPGAASYTFSLDLNTRESSILPSSEVGTSGVAVSQPARHEIKQLCPDVEAMGLQHLAGASQEPHPSAKPDLSKISLKSPPSSPITTIDVCKVINIFQTQSSRMQEHAFIRRKEDLSQGVPNYSPTGLTVKHDSLRLDCRFPSLPAVVYSCCSSAFLPRFSAVVRNTITHDTQVLQESDSRVEDSSVVLEAASLIRMLVAVVQREMKDCELVVGYDEGYSQSGLLEDLLLLLPNVRQVVHINGTADLLGVVWGSLGRRGYLFLLDHPEPFLHFTNTHPHAWDYHGKYVFVAPTKQHLESLATSEKARKTEHIAGVTKSGVQGEWGLYVHQLYWGEGVRRVTTWRDKRFTSHVELFPSRFSDLRGAVLKVVTFEWAPSVFYYRARDGSLLFRYGTDIGVVDTLSEVLNFTVRYEEPPAGERWGREEANGSWSGMMGKLARNEVDIGVVDLYVTIVRVGILDYSAPYDSELSCFMARREPPLPRWQALAFPFQGQTWLAILVGLITSGPVLYLLASGSGRCGVEVKSLQTLSFSWYYALGLHCCEAQVTLPKMRSTRTYVSFLWLYTITLTIAYSTNLTAYLLVAKPPASMENIRDLHASGLEVSGVGKFYGDALASASDPYLQSLTDRFQDYTAAEHIFPRILEGRAVMLQNSPFLEYVAATKFTTRGVSSMRLMKECFAPFSIAMALQRHSPLKRKFDQVIGWMLNGGLIRQFFLRSLRLSAQNSRELEGDGWREKEDEGGEVRVRGGRDVIPLSLDHLQGIFFVIILGWILSTIAFMLETFCYGGVMPVG
ncbi:ionotropic receptor 21a-like [Panulirus ornatus]|uniref:ionotropic receptor 21a-like n=1 Tax=Panulirus ornatus TaxID=150431 RepID=UPI003A849581